MHSEPGARWTLITTSPRELPPSQESFIIIIDFIREAEEIRPSRGRTDC